ncbi:MAG: TonB-dependent receptor, partial [Myxococcota bacterium]
MVHQKNDSKDRSKRGLCFSFVLTAVFCSALPLWTYAQDSRDTTKAKTLQEVLITAKREAIMSGAKLQPIDSATLELYPTDNLFGILSRESFAYIRTYGPSGLSTPTFRGTGGSQTAILWNGVNLQSPMNGSVDFTLMPMAFVDELNVQYGGESALMSSGSMGGALHMHTQKPKKTGLSGSLSSEIGDWATRNHTVKLGWKKKQFSGKVSGLWNQAENNFAFANTFKKGQPIEERKHAGIRQKGILWENHLDLSSKSLLSLRLWHQDNHVEIPAVSSSSQASQATQQDKFTRAMLDMEHHGKWQHHWKATLLHHELTYRNPVIGTESNSRAWQHIHQWEVKTLLSKRIVLQGGLHHNFEWAKVQNYGESRAQRHRWDLFSALRWVDAKERLEVNLNLRQALNGGNRSPFLPGINAKYPIHRAFHLRGSLSKTYRIPTFNDLFWRGSDAMGNPDLLEEEGVSADLGIESRRPLRITKRLSWSASMTVFSNRSKNWITWQTTESGVWTPKNKEEVHAQGIESSMKLHQQLGKWSLHAKFGHTLTEALIVSSNNPNELNKALTYTPKHLGRASIGLQGHGFLLYYNHVINGQQ